MHEIIDTSGAFHYFHGGRYVTGTWTKGSIDETFIFTLADGTPLLMAPGQTFVELPNQSAKVVVKS